MKKDVTRKQFLSHGGRTCLTLAAGGILVQGCGDQGKDDAEPKDKKQGDTKDSKKKQAAADTPPNFLATEADVDPALPFAKGDVKGILVKTSKGIVAYESKCTHQGGPLKHADGQFHCPWHGSKFDAETGEVVGGPAPEPLKKIPIEIVDGNVLLAES